MPACDRGYWRRDDPMKFHSTEVAGAFIVEPEPRRDDRGFLARTFCVEEFGQHGLHFAPVQSYQSRIVGAIYDVILDVRPDSPTYLPSFGVELAADNRLALYVPELVAHGTQALTDGAELLCLAGHAYAPECERGVRYDDPILGNRWPLPTVEVSLKDLAWPPLRSAVGAPR